MFGDYKDITRSLREKYIATTKPEFDILTSREVITVKEKSDLPANTSIDSCIVLLTLKRSGKSKALCLDTFSGYIGKDYSTPHSFQLQQKLLDINGSK